MSRPAEIELSEKLKTEIENARASAVGNGVVVLCYSDACGESDKSASNSAKIDIDNLVAGRERPLYFFGNFTYINEWRIAKRKGILGKQELVALYRNEDGTIATQEFSDSGHAQHWPKVMTVEDDQLRRLLS